jgi:large subunit ribosomal protein L28
MNRKCLFTGRKTRTGNNVSHACNRSKRKFKINLQSRNIILPSGEKISVKMSTRAIKNYTLTV